MIKRMWLVVIFLVAVSVFCEDVDTVNAAQSTDTVQIQTDTTSEIMPDTLTLEQMSSTEEPIKSKSLSYYTIGCINDVLLYPIPTTVYLSAKIFNIQLENHNNALIYLFTYPIGLIFLEKFVTNMIVNKPSFALLEPHSCISLNGQLGIITPTTLTQDNGGPSINMDAKGCYRVALEYEYQLNKGFGIQVKGEGYGTIGHLTEDYLHRLFGVSVGLRFTDWHINVNKILFGYSFINSTSKEYGSDFWGFGIGWSKRYYPYKGLFIEPGISYRFSRTADYSVSIIGIFGGINLGYRF